MISLGILGIAHMHGYSYIREILNRSDGSIIGVCDKDRKKAEAVHRDFNIPVFDNPAEFIRDCHGVVITSENAYHKEYTLLAAQYGKHVLCEKPIATTEPDALAMIDACNKAKVALQMAFPVRYSSTIRKAKQIIDSGKLGQIYAVSTTNHGRMPGGWFIDPVLAGGGAVMDHTVHVVDLLRWLLDTEVKDVSCEYGKLIYDIPVEDCGLMVMTMENGIFATLDCSWSRPKSFPYWGDVTLRIAAENGTLFLSVFDAKIIVASNANGVSYENYGENFDALLIDEFFNTIKHGKKPQTDGKDGLEALKVAVAAYKSGLSKETIKIAR